MSRRAQLGAILGLALALRLANLWLTSALPVAAYQFDWPEGDMATAWAWAGRIAAGDVLGREGTHQYTGWMRAIAPLETWERWWGGRPVFHQAPLYAYVLALVRLAGGGGFWAVGVTQCLLGLASVALVFLLAERTFGRGAALAAGVGAAVYGPFLLHETLVLRDTLAVTTSLLLLWALGRARDGGRGAWLGAGLVFAAAVLARETTLLFAPFVLLWIVQCRGRTRAAAAAAAFAGGAALGLAPLLARNVVVGVAPWALSTRALEGFVYGHAAGGAPVGLTLPPATRTILEQADGHLGAAIRLTLASWGGDWRGLAAHELAKLAAIGASFEAADNANWYYFAERLPLLGCSLGFAGVLALGLVGLVVGERRADDRILRYFLLAALGGLMYATVVGRYRLVPAAVLLVYAGGAVSWILGQLAARRLGRATAAVAAALAVAALSRYAPADAAARQRPTEFVLAAERLYRGGDREAALAELEAGLARAYRGAEQPALPPGYRRLVESLVRIQLERGRPADAAAALGRLAADYPGDADLRQLLGLLHRDALGDPARAEAYFVEAERLRAGTGAAGANP